MAVSGEQRAHWRARMAAFRASGLSAEAWARTEGVTAHQMAYWTRQFPADTSPERTAVAPFAAVTVREDAGSPDAPGLVVEVGAARIAVRAGFDGALLRAVVRALGDASC